MSGKRIRTLLGQLGLTQVRLALLTALASYQVDRSVIDKFRLDWPDELKPRLLGVQACLWSENLHDRRLFNHMTFPRLSAIAESAWTPSNRKHFGRFMAVRTLMRGAGIE